MAAVSKSGTPSVASQVVAGANKITGLLAGEAIAAGDACYVAAAGTVFRTVAAGVAGVATNVDGFAAGAAATGEAVTLVYNCHIKYGAALTPGTFYYASTTAGGLDTVASVAPPAPVARSIDDQRIWIQKSY